ncbi:MAG: DMT family transporter [Candidatus Sigynarchaeota archaeon]
MENYFIGIMLGITAGVCLNIGFILQKKAVNDISPEARSKKLLWKLIRNPVWLVGLVVQILGSAVLVMIAQFFIGPALLPGLMAAGLIVMAIGAAKILKETLKRAEYVGITLMILAIVLLALTGLSVDVESQNLLDPGFLLRASLFTIILFAVILVCEIFQRKVERFRGMLLALQSGTYLALANFWVSPFSINLGHLFGGMLVWPDEFILGLVGGIMLAITNVLAISVLQKAFTCAQATNVVPLQQLPINIAPVFVYFGIFLLAPPTPYAIPFMIAGIATILVSSFFLTKRQAKLGEIK